MTKRATAARPRYHHGDLRAALIEAATRLVSENRVETFSVADAARAAGVSSGAPYRHFADRDDLLDHVAATAFDRMHDQTMEAMAAEPPGSLESVVAGGYAYVAFAAENPELFHLMWGATRPHGPSNAAQGSGQQCHAGFIEVFTKVMEAQGLGGLDPYEFSMPLWAMVHGYASLLLGPAEKVPREPEAIRAMIDVAVRAYFAGRLAARRAPAD
jgi:AcrR family transcriptional regulator